VKWLLSGLRQNFRDVVLTGFGAWIIWKQVYSQNPNGYLALIGLAFMLPSARAAVISILSEPGPSLPSSSSTSERREPPSTATTEGGRNGNGK